MNLPQAYYDLIERFERPGCAVCALTLRASKQFMESLLYEFSLDEGVQLAFRSGRGLCNHHSWELVHHHGYSLGVSFLFQSALDEVIEILSAPSPLASGIQRLLGRDALADRLEAQAPCVVCANMQEAEARLVQTFATNWATDALQAAFRTSQGLCLPHVRGVLREMETAATRRELVEFHLAKWTALKRELDQFQIKSAYNYVGEPMGAEADSWKRAVASLTGSEHAVPVLTRTKRE